LAHRLCNERRGVKPLPLIDVNRARLIIAAVRIWLRRRCGMGGARMAPYLPETVNGSAIMRFVR
jgi:hypothetical protein